MKAAEMNSGSLYRQKEPVGDVKGNRQPANPVADVKMLLCVLYVCY